MRYVCLFLLGAATAAAQPFSWGLKAGVTMSDFLSTVRSGQLGFDSTTNRYIVGPTVELRLPLNLALEVDALYRHFSYRGSGNVAAAVQNVNTTGGAWEFPLLVKYRFPMRVARPFVDAGMAWDTLSGIASTIKTPELVQNTTKGFVIGGGIDIRILRAHVQPEIRFTRWGAKHFSDASGLLRSTQSQGEFLLGITF
jgi:hypothetical protein